MDTDSNVNVNEISDITFLLVDVSQAEQMPNLQWHITVFFECLDALVKTEATCSNLLTQPFHHAAQLNS